MGGDHDHGRATGCCTETMGDKGCCGTTGQPVPEGRLVRLVQWLLRSRLGGLIGVAWHARQWKALSTAPR